MSDDTGSPKNIDTVRPEAGDGDDVYSASTKVGVASSELLALIRGENTSALRAPAVPAEASGEAAETDAAATKAPPASQEGAQEAVTAPGPAADRPATAAPEAAAASAREPDPGEIERKLEDVGRPGVGAGPLLAVLVLALLALWFGWQATQPAPEPPAPATSAP